MSGDGPAEGTYLDAIVSDVRRHLAAPGPRRVVITDPGAIDPAQPVARAAADVISCAGAVEASKSAGRLGVIAEVKRRSPSRGAIDSGLDAGRLAERYVEGGAVAISVLTEPDHFGGSLADLDVVRAAVPHTAVLRKDFMVEPVQFVDTVRHGADVVLVIAALYPEWEGELGQCVEFAHRHGFEVLLEVHDEAELERALQTDARLIGINNRDLRTFAVDLAVTERLAPLVPADRLVVSESGISTPDDAARMRAAGADALLVGEALVRSPDPAALVHALSEAGR